MSYMKKKNGEQINNYNNRQTTNVLPLGRVFTPYNVTQIRKVFVKSKF